MNKRDDLIQQCRYYHGEKENPYQSTDIQNDKMAWFWDMERVYVLHEGTLAGEGEFYKAIDGKTYPGIPYNLLMVMFTSWAKHSYDTAKELQGFYNLMDEYLFIANDHFPEDRIPNQ